MNVRKLMIGLMGMSLMAIGGMTAQNAGAAEVRVYLDTPPPPLRVEVAPQPRAGYVWVPGYWDVKDKKHVWREGYWIREREGYYYVGPNWVERNDRWELEPGSWRKGDRDRDGVPNGRDSAPFNPNRE